MLYLLFRSLRRLIVFTCISFDVLAIFFRGSSTSVVSIALKRNPKFKDSRFVFV